MSTRFGTDGVRGVVNEELTAEFAFKLGKSIMSVLPLDIEGKPKVLISRDTRISGHMLECAVASGLCSVGVDVVLLGVVPTPAMSYLTKFYEADAGISICDSDSLKEYNGIIIFNNDGSIFNGCINLDKELTLPSVENLGTVSRKNDCIFDYISFVKSTVTSDLKGMKIAVDCANGVNSIIGPDIFEDLGATVFAINNAPDGTNVNLDCGTSNLEGLQNFVVESGADVGIAFNGNGDKVIFVDEHGNVVNGDSIITICATDMKNKNQLNDDTILLTADSNLGLVNSATENEITVLETEAGHESIAEEVVANNYSIGGDQSGYIIFPQYSTVSDGLVTALQTLCVYKTSGMYMSSLASSTNALPHVSVIAKVKNENLEAYLEDTLIIDEIKQLNKTFDGNGKALIKPDDNGNLEVILEGKDLEFITKRANDLAQILELKYN